MKKLMLLTAIAGGLMFAGMTQTASADHGRYRFRSNHYHHNHWHGSQRNNYRGWNTPYGNRSGVILQFNYGSPRQGYGFSYGQGYYNRPYWGGGYGRFNNCW